MNLFSVCLNAAALYRLRYNADNKVLSMKLTIKQGQIYTGCLEFQFISI